MINTAFDSLDKFCQESEYRGWDLFDGLNSKLLKKTPLFNSPFIRLAWIQFFKKSPINLRKLAFVSKGLNPKGLGLFASALIAQNKKDEAKGLLNTLLKMTCEGHPGMSWGYNFPWQARAFYVPVGTPNMVTTVFVANAFLDYFDSTGSEQWLEHARESCEFILKSLILFENDSELCFGYIPGEQARVHNANMLGAGLLAGVYQQTEDQTYLEKSRKAINYSMQALTDDYFWPYGELDHHRFIDNFHTGFNLVALKNWTDCTGDQTWTEKLIAAYDKFQHTFWLDDGCPKYYHNSLYPIDIHCSAQGIVTCLKLEQFNPNSVEMAQKIAKWAIDNMQDEAGYFYYQKTRFYTNKIPYIRWAQAWMFYALSLLIAKLSNNA